MGEGEPAVVHEVVHVLLALGEQDFARNDRNQDGRDDGALRVTTGTQSAFTKIIKYFTHLIPISFLNSINRKQKQATHADSDQNCNYASGQALGHDIAVAIALKQILNHLLMLKAHIECDGNEPEGIRVQQKRILLAAKSLALGKGPGGGQPEDDQEHGQ